MIRSTILVVALTAFGSSPAPIDLSGTWVPDLATYEHTKALKAVDPKAPAAPPAPAGSPDLPSVRISHEKQNVVFEYLDHNGGVVSKLILATDGRQSLNERAGGALTQQSHSYWMKSILHTKWVLKRGDARVLGGSDNWRLSDDGTALTLTSQMEDSKSQSRTKTVYRRKP